MKKFAMFLMLAIFAAMAMGCVKRENFPPLPIPLPQMEVETNIPLNKTIFTVFNETGYRLRLVNDGRWIATLGTRPKNNFFPIRKRNWHSYTVESSVTATALDANDNSMGTASTSFWVNGQQGQSKTWTVTLEQLQTSTRR